RRRPGESRYRLGMAFNGWMSGGECWRLAGLAGLGVTDGARTHDNRSHSPGLYQLSYDHHRTVYNTFCYCTAVMKLVGVERFELPTSCSQSRRATRLRYTPKPCFIIAGSA